MVRRTFFTITCVTLIASAIFAGLVLPGCRQKEKQMTTEQKAVHEKPSSQSSTIDNGTTATQKTGNTEPKKDETNVVVKVAMDSARSNNPDLPELRVVEAKMIGDQWARVVLEPVDRSTDAATWLMRKENGKWTVFDFGTALMPENHPEAPAELYK
jgi:hypothetical protein